MVLLLSAKLGEDHVLDYTQANHLFAGFTAALEGDGHASTSQHVHLAVEISWLGDLILRVAVSLTGCCPLDPRHLASEWSKYTPQAR